MEPQGIATPLRSVQDRLGDLAALLQHGSTQAEDWHRAFHTLEAQVAQLGDTIRQAMPLAECPASEHTQAQPTAAPGRPLQQTEIELLERCALLETILDHTHVQMAYLDAQFNFVVVNTPYAHGSGYTKEQLLGRNHFDLFPHAENQAIFARVRDTGVPAEYTAKPFVFPNQPELGTTYWDWTLIPVPGPDSATRGLILALIDVTERERVRQSRDRLADIIEATPDMVSTATPEGEIVYFNRAARELLGIPPDEPLAGYRIPMVHPAWANDIVQRVGIPAALRDGLWQGETAVRHHSGREIPVSQVIVAQRDPKGELRFLSTVIRNISEIKEAAAERERLLAQVRREQALLQAVIQNIPGGIVVSDEEGRIRLANPTALAIFANDMPYGQAWDSGPRPRLWHPSGVFWEPRDRPLIRAAVDGETCTGVEMLAILPNEQWRSLLVGAAPISDEQGHRIGAVCVFQDVTEHNQLRLRLQLYADRLRLLHEADRAILEAQSIEETAAAVLKHLLNVAPLLRASVTLFDLDNEELCFVAVVPGRERTLSTGWRGPLSVAWFLDELRQGRTYETADLANLPSSPWVQALRDEQVAGFVSMPLIAQGELIGSLNMGFGAGTPLTEDARETMREIARELAIALQQARLRARLQSHAEELEALVQQRTAEVRASEARYRSLFENSIDGIMLSAPDGRVFSANAAICRALGRSEEEICRLGRAGIVDPADPRLADALVQRQLSGSFRGELLLLHQDGTRIPCEVSSAIFHDEDGNVRTSLIVRDMREHKRAEAALIQAEKLALLGRLAASLTHEINNPLQSVMGCLGLAQEALAEGRSADRYLTVARADLRRAVDIVSRLRDMQRRSRPQDRQPAPIDELVQHVLTLIEKKCADRRIAISSAVDDSLPTLTLVRDQIVQVLLNIALNAVDAMPDGGELRLSAHADAQGVTLTVTDTGAGMDPETREHLFQPFFTTKRDGMGLGLYVSSNIVQEHGGRVEVCSEKGKGSTFTIWLPRT